MTTDNQAQTSNTLFKVLVLIAVGAVLFAVMANLFLKSQQARSKYGRPFPKLQAEGWLNGNAPTKADIKGKVLVVDAFAYWCVPCELAAPELVALHEKYTLQGAMFIGLTNEASDELPRTKRFLERTKIDWLIGYGVYDTLVELGHDTLPHIWVVNHDGRIVWSSGYRGGLTLHAAIEAALEDAKQ